jgi:DUF4097 and DUF4098 domain-containing protein YvlB
MPARFPALLLCLSLTSVLATSLAGCSNRCAPQFRLASFSPDSGAVNVHKMAGDIDVKDAPNGADLATMGGNITVGSVSSFAKLSTMGGNIAVEHANGSVYAHTMGGTITFRQVNGPVNASTMGGDVTVHLNGSSSNRRDIELSSMGGAILLTVPKNFGMDVKIKLGYTHGHEDVRIVQHLGLTERQSTEWETHEGSPRKYLWASGRVGDGLNHVTIDTVNGDVILKQE